MKKIQDGKLSVSEFICSLIRLQASLFHHIEGKGLKNTSTVLPELHKVNTEFQEHEVLFSSVETKLQETLNKVQINCEALCKGTVDIYTVLCFILLLHVCVCVYVGK
jgi:hypothetical protein